MSLENLLIISSRFTGIKIKFHEILETSVIAEIQGLLSDGSNFETLARDAVRNEEELINLIEQAFGKLTE